MGDSLSRRAWLKTAAAGLACGASLSRVHAGQFTGRIKKGLKFSMIREPLSIADKFKLVKDLGYEGLEVHMREKLDRRELAKAVETTGLPIHGMLNSSDPDLRSAIDVAKYVNATSVLVVAGRVNAETSYDENYRITQERIRAAAPYAEKQQIRLLVENVWNDFLLSPLEMVRYLDEIDSPWVGAYFDVGNVVRFGWPEQWVRLLGKRIGKVDIKEYSRKKEEKEGSRAGFDVPLGEGDVNWPAVRKELLSIDYHGWCTAEIKGGDRQRLADIAQRMDKVLDLA